MKKALIIILCIVALVAAIVIFTGKDEPSENPSTTLSGQEAETTTEYVAPTLENGTKNPDKLVKITLPLSYYDASNQCDISGFFQKSSYESCKVNQSKRTFTVTMKSITHDFMLSNVGLQTMKSLADLIDSGKYPYMKAFGKYNADFSEIEFLVDAKKYKAATDTDELLTYIASCGVFYQLYTTEDKYECKVTISSEKSGKLLDEFTVKQSNSDL